MRLKQAGLREVTLADRVAIAFGSLVLSVPLAGLYWLLFGSQYALVAPAWVMGAIVAGFALLGFFRPWLASDALAACVRALRWF